MRIATTLCMVISGLGLAAAVPAAAEQAVAVNVAKVNLADQAERARLEQRIERAARSLCAVDPMLRSAAVQDEVRKCRTDTVAAARSQVEMAVREQRAREIQVAGI